MREIPEVDQAITAVNEICELVEQLCRRADILEAIAKMKCSEDGYHCMRTAIGDLRRDVDALPDMADRLNQLVRRAKGQ